MKKQIMITKIHPAVVRVGIICSLSLAIYFVMLAGLSDLPRVFAFMGLVAVCFVLVMKLVVDMLIWMVNFAARFSGMGLGHLVRVLRRFLLTWKNFRHTH